MTAPASIPAPEGRCDKRTNIFLGATLRFDGRTAAVRVRDLSAQGAQVEGTVLPDRDGRATLERGSVFADCVVAWRTVDRCGLHFCTPLPIASWWPGRELPRTQADVDWTVAEVRAEIAAGLARSRIVLAEQVAAMPGEADPTIDDLARTLPARIAEELACVARLLGDVGAILSRESVVVARHPASLKQLEGSANLVTQLAALLETANPADALPGILDADLRRRLMRGGR